MTTLYEALLDTARLCGILKSGKTTLQGASNFVVDITRYEDDDYFNNGTVFIRSGTYALHTARVLDYTKVNGNIQVDPSAAVNFSIPSEVYYSITNEGREALVQAINQALFDIGTSTEIDETLTVSNHATEYTLPSGVSNIKRIEVASFSASPNNFNRTRWWKELGGTLYLRDSLVQQNGNKIRLHYTKRAPDINLDADVIGGAVDPERLAWVATYYFLRTRLQYSGNTDDREGMLLSEAQTKVERFARAALDEKTERDVNLARW